MKKIFLLLCTAAMFAACETANNETETDTTEVTGVKEENSVLASAEKDPICGMDKTADWTEYTVEGTDTTWFCSETCKETYAARQSDKAE